MKKLIAVLTACMAVTCIFSSCGDEKKDESSVSESSSVQDEAETITESETESETEEETEAETTLAESESETEEASAGETESATHEYLEDADPTAFLGKWECEKIVNNGEEMTELMGMPVYALYQYDIMEGGTAGLSESLMEVAAEGDNLEYKWGLISETEIEITGPDGSAIQFTLDGDYLVNVDDNSKTEIYLKKVDEFQFFDFQAFADNYQSQQDEVVLTPVETDAEGNIIESSETTTAE